LKCQYAATPTLPIVLGNHYNTTPLSTLLEYQNETTPTLSSEVEFHWETTPASSTELTHHYKTTPSLSTPTVVRQHYDTTSLSVVLKLGYKCHFLFVFTKSFAQSHH
jgi:hypothetical protein